MSALECLRCWAVDLQATGRFNESRFGARRAELRCRACGHLFSTGREEALALAHEALGAVGSVDVVAAAEPFVDRLDDGLVPDVVRDSPYYRPPGVRHLDDDPRWRQLPEGDR